MQSRLKDAKWVATARPGLQRLSSFVLCLKESLSAFQPRGPEPRGVLRGTVPAFGHSRSSISSEHCPHVDLNPVAAGVAEEPEVSVRTAIKRDEHVREQGRAEDLKAAKAGSVAGSNAAQGPAAGLRLDRSP